MVGADLKFVSQSSVSRIVRKISVLFAQHLADYVHLPRTEAEQRNNIVRFSEMHNFPTVAGCVDGTHIPIKSPGGDNAETFRNRKGFFSLNVQVVSGPRLEILDIVVRHPGSAHDSLIFDRSSVRVVFEQRRVLGTLLGDSGYPCRPYLLTPVINPANDAERRYNVSHRSTRNTVERLFGVWKRRFPCLTYGLRTKLETSQAVICALAVLHNISLGHNDFFEEIGVQEEELDNPQHHANDNALGIAFRRQFIIQHF